MLASFLDFSLYKGGIFVQTKKASEPRPGVEPVEGEGKTIPIKMTDQAALAQAEAAAEATARIEAMMADQPLDHAITIIGWETDKSTGIPVWIVRNSYGDQWGMNGDFLVRRGQDGWGLESEISSFAVDRVSTSSAKPF